MSPEQWPCYGEHHLGSVRANPHGQWQHCQVCNIRWMYVPRRGSHGQNTKTDAPPLVQRMLDELKVLMNSERPSAETVHAMQKKVDADIVLEDLVHRQISKIQGERNMPEQTGKAVVKSSGYPSTSPATPTSRNKTKGQTSSPSSWEICTPPPTDHFEKDVKQLLNPKEREQLMQLLEERKAVMEEQELAAMTGLAQAYEEDA